MLDTVEIGARLAGKYMGFKLDDEHFGLEILKVQEILGLVAITAVPRAPGFVRGVINLRGEVIPVIDLRRKFGMPARDDTDLTGIMVVQGAIHDTLVTMGVIVDEVSEIMDLTADHAEPVPSFGDPEAERVLLGIGKVQGTVVRLLDVDRILTSGELTLLDAVSEES